MVDCLWTESTKKRIERTEPDEMDLENNQFGQRNNTHYRVLMVNAQTGKLYSPLSREKNREFCDGFPSWEDIGGKPKQ